MPDNQQPVAPADGQQQQPQQQWSGRDLTDEEKAMHDTVYGLAARILYDDKFLPKAKDLFEKSPTPVMGAATLATVLGAKVIQEAKKAGKQIPSAALLSAGWAVMQEIRDFAAEVMGVDLSDDQMQAAFLNAADQLSDMVQGSDAVRMDVTPEERQAMAEMAGGEEGTASRLQQARQAAMPQPESPKQSMGLGERP